MLVREAAALRTSWEDKPCHHPTGDLDTGYQAEAQRKGIAIELLRIDCMI